MISIIVPAYNIENFIGRCIESIIHQTYRDWELLIIDDGSTDNTWNVISNYAKIDKRIKAFHKENGGVSSARNFGLDNAKGEYISLIDGDDWIESTLYEDAIRSLYEYNVDVFMFEYYIDNENKSIKHNIDYSYYGLIDTEQALVHSIRPHNRFAWSKVFSSKLLKNRETIDKIRFNSDIIIGEDTLFIIEVLLNSNRTYYTNEAYYHYDQRLGSAVRSSFNEKKISGLQAYQSVNELFLKNGYYKAYEYGCGALLSLGIQLGTRMLQSKSNNNDKIFQIIQNYIKPINKRVLFSRRTDFHTRIKALGSLISLQTVCKLLQKG